LAFDFGAIGGGLDIHSIVLRGRDFWRLKGYFFAIKIKVPSGRDKIGASFWHRKRDLITGHLGFKAAWLTVWPVQRGGQNYRIRLK
jgi:hypothetical protein